MQDNYKQELTDRFVMVVEHLTRLTYSGRLDEWQGLEMTIPQIRTLILLQHMGPLRMGIISSHLDSTLSATTSIVDRLVEKELVKRISDPNDRRVVLCELTALGQEATERFWRLGRALSLRMAGLLEVEQLEAVVQALELIQRTEEAFRKRSAQRDLPTK